MNRLFTISNQLDSLTIFHNLLDTPVMMYLKDLLSCTDDPFFAVKSYSDFVSELFQHTDNLSDYIYQFVLEDENFYVKDKARGKSISSVIEDCLENELKILKELSLLSSKKVKSTISYDGFLPDWNNRLYDFTTSYQERLQNIHRFGYGMYAKYHAFTLTNGSIMPVKYPDTQTLEHFTRYEKQRAPIIQNTLVLLKGEYASNVLLYGDAGTGKSSTVKAIVNRYKDEGLRLIEVKKHEIFYLPDLLEALSENPLKFIIFIDDLSFAKNDDNFSTLKAILEGGVSARSKNVAIYATSNRRHLVKEQLSDRDGDEVHINDTLQEITSLAARFGLTVTFEKPNKDVYLQIVRSLAAEYGLDLNDEQLILRAEAFAIRNNGRSPRTARQFVELQKSGL